MKANCLVLYILLLIPVLTLAGGLKIKRTIHWSGVQQIQITDGEERKIVRCEECSNNEEQNFAPVYFEKLELAEECENMSATLKNLVFEPLTTDEQLAITGIAEPAVVIKPDLKPAHEMKKPVVLISFIPLRKNEVTGLTEKLVSFELELSYVPVERSGSETKPVSYAENSALAEGNWYKIAVSNTGIHRLTAQDLSALGMNVSTLDPRNIRIYGNGGGMLSENVNDFRYDDLQENAIYVSGETDGVFDAGDYILFYGESQDVWKYSASDNKLHKYPHLYSDRNYYFITGDAGAGKRIQNQSLSQQTPTLYSNKYNDAIHHELETNNLISTGRMWYGEIFDMTTSFVQTMSIPNRDPGSPIRIDVDVAAKSDVQSQFDVYMNDVYALNLPCAASSHNTNINADFAKTKFDSTSLSSSAPDLNIRIEYNKPLSSSVGYLNYFTVNFVRNLSYEGSQMIFRDFRTANLESITEYTISKVTGQLYVWNITDRLNPKYVGLTSGNNQHSFRIGSVNMQEYIAFDGSSWFPVELIGKIENQNLHGLEICDLIIVTPPDFYAEASRLAEHHRNYDGMKVEVVRLQNIYNEFSSGAADITAIRDFVKMLYDKASAGDEPKYLLLFGDASFDYKNRIANNTNFVPTWESMESLNPVGSYITDDFFGWLDGDNMLDIGIGRFVVFSQQQAKEAVDKTIHYAVNSVDVMNDWRNIICLIADDEDSNLHFNDSEKLAVQIDTSNKNINIDKIYLDAYVQESTPSGELYPKVTQDITNRVERGALIINYVGHGGEGGLAHERIVTIADINGWDNYDNLPVFLTATCEFSRFDDPERTSAGELIFLNPHGGGISLFSTTRATYAGANGTLNRNFYNYTLQKSEGEYLRMGDVIRYSKNASGSNDNTRKFVLLGDPALKFAFPEYNVITTKINGISVTQDTDTLKALSNVTISGEMQDYLGNKLTGFNGVLFPVVYDKPTRYTTLANDDASIEAVFYIQKNPLYKGACSVTNGEWSFSFIVPKDIAYSYGYGKISLYARSENKDAAGFYNDVVVGGYEQNYSSDNTGPVVELFMNDENFVAGGLTDENPLIFAKVQDESGINTVGSGIGHDIQATLDDENNYILNDFYKSELDDYTKGTISYPLYDLTSGEHNLSLRVWDIKNNSTIAYTDFIVAESHEIAIDHLMNFPNPFKETTRFAFEHNQDTDPLLIDIEIYTREGELVTILNDEYDAGGFKYTSPYWYGTDERGARLKQGLYIYRVKVRTADGLYADETSKLVIIR
jgi:hypothetical protein